MRTLTRGELHSNDMLQQRHEHIIITRLLPARIRHPKVFGSLMVTGAIHRSEIECIGYKQLFIEANSVFPIDRCNKTLSKG